ncbi:MAG: type II toxin-antitoxin system Phd/YefM family antitoxin [Nitrospinae bacterium]|nr:type II toxin-antitoxin system Phd/YefM family antitoxin [Nitrospinota bacterium]
MTKLKVSNARKEFAETINKVAYGKERIVIEKFGKDIVAVVPIADLRLIEEMEDHLDLEAVRKALADPKNKKPIAWDKIRKDFGV